MLNLKERLPGFVQLSEDEGVSLYEPAERNKVVPTLNDKQQSPDLIVFCSWMSAAPKHIAKYTAGYQRFYPKTPILLIEAKMGHMFQGNTMETAFKVIEPYIKGKKPLANRTASIVLHASSNGGANNAALLATRIKDESYGSPFDSVILDCSPGEAELKSSTRAIVLSLPNVFLLRTISSVLVYLLLCLYKLYCEGLGKQNKISWIRETINDNVLMGVGNPRLYLYSKGDRLVEARHVHEHAKDARRRDCGDVREEVFEKASHCALLNEDAERYWGAVTSHIEAESKPFAVCSYNWSRPWTGMA